MITHEMLKTLSREDIYMANEYFDLEEQLQKNLHRIERYKEAVNEIKSKNFDIQERMKQLFVQESGLSESEFPSLFDRPEYPITYEELKQWTRSNSNAFQQAKTVVEAIFNNMTIDRLTFLIDAEYLDFNGKEYATLSIYTYLSDIRKVMLGRNFSDNSSSDEFVAWFFDNLNDIGQLVADELSKS
jgi:predicted nuclease with TOPRIM domain